MKILVPVDGSAYSMEGVKVALDMAKTKGAEVIFITVNPFVQGLDLEISAGKWAGLEDEMKRRGEEILTKAKDILAAGGITARGILSSAVSASDQIIETAEKEKADLIIIGSKGLGGKATRFFMGSVALKVVSHAPCNIYVVKTA